MPSTNHSAVQILVVVLVAASVSMARGSSLSECLGGVRVDDGVRTTGYHDEYVEK